MLLRPAKKRFVGSFYSNLLLSGYIQWIYLQVACLLMPSLNGGVAAAAAVMNVDITSVRRGDGLFHSTERVTLTS